MTKIVGGALKLKSIPVGFNQKSKAIKKPAAAEPESKKEEPTTGVESRMTESERKFRQI